MGFMQIYSKYNVNIMGIQWITVGTKWDVYEHIYIYYDSVALSRNGVFIS